MFEGPTSIKLGGGNDTLQIGINGGQAYNSAQFEDSAQLNGGSGDNTLSNADVNVFDVTPVIYGFGD